MTDITSEPLAKDAAEKKILAVLDDMDKNQRRGMMNVPKPDGRLLRLLVETTNAKQVVEIGTSNGYSGIWMALALLERYNIERCFLVLEAIEQKAGFSCD